MQCRERLRIIKKVIDVDLVAFLSLFYQKIKLICIIAIIEQTLTSFEMTT